MIALQISKALKQRIESNEAMTASVHMVFNSAINLMSSDGHLIGVLATQKDLAPMSVTVDVSSFEDFAIQPGDEVQLSEEAIRFLSSDLIIALGGAEIVDLKLEKRLCNDLDSLDCKLAQIREIILEQGSLEGIAGLVESYEFTDTGTMIKDHRLELNEYSRFIQQRLIDFLNLIMKKDMKAAEIMLPKIIGFGPGLTPSTDDFLAGIIAVRQCVYENPTVDWTSCFKGRTTLVSEDMIRYIEMGCISESHKHLVEGLFDDHRADVRLESKDVLKTGSSSGSDFLFGTYCMAKLYYHEVQAQKER